jgi:hypothetical protein
MLFRSIALTNQEVADGAASHPLDAGSNDELPSSNINEADDDPGADDFFPIFIWVVMQANVPNLLSHCEFIQAFHNPFRLMGRAGYCLVNLQSACEFIISVEADSLNMDKQLFEAELAAAARQKN